MSGKSPRLKVKLKAEAVWELLNRLNINQNDLARLAGITSGYLSLLMSGKRCPSVTCGGGSWRPSASPASRICSSW